MEPSARQLEILTAARDLAAERGFEGTTMADIAAKVGVVESALYRHFESKRDLFRQMIRQFYQPILSDMEQAASGITDPFAIVRYSIWRTLRSFAEEPELNRVIILHARQSHEERDTGVSEFNRRYTAVLVKGVAAGIDRNLFRSDLNPRLVRDMIFGMVEHVWLRYERHGEKLDVEKLTEEVLDLIVPTLLPARVPVNDLAEQVERLTTLVSRLEDAVRPPLKGSSRSRQSDNESGHAPEPSG